MAWSLIVEELPLMSQRETAAAIRLRDKVCRPKDRWERVENGVVAGMPDVNYVIAGQEGWIEVKTPHEPAREDTALFGSSNHNIELEQSNWFLKQLNAGGRAFLFIATERRVMVLDCRTVAMRHDLNKLSAVTLQKIALWASELPVKDPERWFGLREILCGPV